LTNYTKVIDKLMALLARPRANTHPKAAKMKKLLEWRGDG